MLTNKTDRFVINQAAKRAKQCRERLSSHPAQETATGRAVLDALEQIEQAAKALKQAEYLLHTARRTWSGTFWEKLTAKPAAKKLHFPDHAEIRARIDANEFYPLPLPYTLPDIKKPDSGQNSAHK